MQNSGSPDEALGPVLRNTNDDLLRSPHNEKANYVLCVVSWETPSVISYLQYKSILF